MGGRMTAEIAERPQRVADLSTFVRATLALALLAACEVEPIVASGDSMPEGARALSLTLSEDPETPVRDAVAGPADVWAASSPDSCSLSCWCESDGRCRVTEPESPPWWCLWCRR